MSGGLEARAAALAEARVAAARARVAAAIGEAMPGVAVKQEEGGVVLTGRGLLMRWLGDPALRWIAGMLR